MELTIGVLADDSLERVERVGDALGANLKCIEYGIFLLPVLLVRGIADLGRVDHEAQGDLARHVG